MNFSKVVKEFPVVVYGEKEEYNDTISKARCRIFYKYFNRNGTYISDEFADKLISTLPYAPIKGIYNEFTEDYTDHGKKRDLGRIYGVVPKENNFAWEAHTDEDGVERIYACTDILLFTALYEEADEIIGKSQSMELYEPSIKGSWEKIAGREAFVFTDGAFLGLQVLGDDVEPCFEGAAFYNQLFTLVKTLEESISSFQNNNEGGNGMDEQKVIFKLSDNEKYDVLFSLMNPNYNKEGDWTVERYIIDVYEPYAIAYNVAEKKYQRVYYTKDDEKDEVTLGEIVDCYIVDVTESEKKALEAIQAFNGGTYENADKTIEQVKELESEAANYGTKKEEYENNISTLTTERDDFKGKYEAANETINALNSELEPLQQYKLDKEDEEKQNIIDQYNERLSEETLIKYTEEKANYTANELKKELAYELVEANPAIFALEEDTLIPTNNGGQKSELEEMLDRYKK